MKENEELVDGCMPVLKNFLKVVRDHSANEKNLFQDRKRDIEDLKKFRDEFLDHIIECEKKIMNV